MLICQQAALLFYIKVILYYADTTGSDYIPTVFLAGCIHGGEFEGTVALMNLISLLETGVDLAGKSNDKILELANKLHIVIMPMCNPDGRSRVPFDNFVGHSFRDLRYYGQGTWKDGELCGFSCLWGTMCYL